MLSPSKTRLAPPPTPSLPRDETAARGSSLLGGSGPTVGPGAVLQPQGLTGWGTARRPGTAREGSMLHILPKCLGRGWPWGDGDPRLVPRPLAITPLGTFLGWVLEHCDETLRGGGGPRHCLPPWPQRARTLGLCALCLIHTLATLTRVHSHACTCAHLHCTPGGNRTPLKGRLVTQPH